MRLLPSFASYFDVSVENTTAQTNVEKPMLSSIIRRNSTNSFYASGRPPASAGKILFSWAQCQLYESYEVATIIRIVLWCIGRKHYSSNECWKAHAIFDYLLTAAPDPTARQTPRQTPNRNQSQPGPHTTSNIESFLRHNSAHRIFKIWGCYHHLHRTLMYRSKTL